MIETGTVIGVSVHSQTDPVYVDKFKPVYKLMQDWIKKGVRVELRPSIVHWQRQYKGFGDKLVPSWYQACYQAGTRPVPSWYSSFVGGPGSTP